MKIRPPHTVTKRTANLKRPYAEQAKPFYERIAHYTLQARCTLCVACTPNEKPNKEKELSYALKVQKQAGITDRQ